MTNERILKCSDDPTEATDLAASMPDKVDELKARLEELKLVSSYIDNYIMD